MSIRIDKEVDNMIRAHAVKIYPEECCGALYSRLDTDERVIVDFKEIKNVEEEGNKERNYIISPEDYMEAEKYAEENRLSLAGIYHSHPDHPAVPSEKDLKRAMPVFTYIIIKVKGSEESEVRAWKLDEHGKFREETINYIFKEELQ